MYSHLSCISKPINNYQIVANPDVYVKGTGIKHLKKLGRSTMVLGRSIMVLGSSTMVLGRSTMVLRRPTMVLGKPIMILGRSTMVSGRSTMAMKGLVCSRAFQKNITHRGQKLFIIPLIYCPLAPHIGV